MRLKNLTVFGFKSFADKTSLNFQAGITAIVGPNGCGKSNVADAIRWVLGEQSAKALRGGEMADVIFNGTDGRKPLSMAEVSLTISDIDTEHLKAAGVELDYHEVTLTRRVFRDGGSEYFINKTACRLKDIQQLFMGTGVGRTSYSIMAQGNITQILSSKPEDRRMVFEEAAGITKFKVQRKEALRKLEYTDQNLLRVTDLIREVKRQIGSLQRQAGKARRYKQIQTELQHLETQLARHQFDVLQTEITERQQTVEKLRTEIELGSETVARSENEITQLRERLTELEQQVRTSQQRGVELKGQIERHEHRIQFNQSRLHELETQNATALGDITQADERRVAAELEFAAVNERIELATAGLEQQRDTLQQKRESLQVVERELLARQESLRQAQAASFGAAQQLTRVRNDINNLELQKQGNLARLEKLSSEKIQLEEERSGLEARLAEFASTVEAEKAMAQTHRGTVEERQQRLRQLQQELNQAGQQLDGLLREQAGLRSRLNVLEQLVESHEGFGAGALAALKQSQAVLGSLADKIRVPDQFVSAVEHALGHHLQLVLTEQPDAARAILEDLKNGKKGRASIAALGLKSSGEATTTTPPMVLDPEVTGRLAAFQGTAALQVIEADASVQPLLNALLGRMVIVNDLAVATEAFQQMGGVCDFVTQGGELLNHHGVFTGGYLNGSGSGKNASSILGRKNQISDLKAQIARLHEQSDEVSRHKGALQSEQTSLQASLQQAQTELRAQEVAMATRQGEFNALQTSRRLLAQKVETVAYEIQNVTAREQEAGDRRAGLAAQVEELEQREQAAQTQVAEFTAGLETLRQQRDTANATLTETKVALATEEQVFASLRRQQQPLEQRIRELTQLATQRRAEIDSVIKRRAQAEAEITDSQQQIESLQHQRELTSVETAELLSQKSEVEREVGTREESLREGRRMLTERQNHRGTLEIELAQKAMSVQNLREKVQQKYQLNLDDIRSECITITIATEGPARIETLSPEQMTDAGVATDWNSVAEQVAALQKRIEEIGPVNLVAIEEYEETEQRHQFLTQQCDDLVKAKEQLMEVINRINTQTREMFVETFTKIRDNFRAMFSEIFGGGKADLQLVEEGDVLESGIEIMARPPGKQLQSISLLSGGEQTMTAVALLFSIYQVKPSPFCVLDELDAPLDESNINRFIRVLQRFVTLSQFVIITHNKRTIGMADVLYGVTMQEHGVSKIVSVKFHKADEQPTGDRAMTPLVPPMAPLPAPPKEEAKTAEQAEAQEIMMAK